jgi:hypothetical protein
MTPNPGVRETGSSSNGLAKPEDAGTTFEECGAPILRVAATIDGGIAIDKITFKINSAASRRPGPHGAVTYLPLCAAAKGS